MSVSAPARSPKSTARSGSSKAGDSEHEILFQTYFKSVGPRTYAAQVKKAGNGNHYVVLTEGKRDDKSGKLWKTRVFVYGEDFIEFFKLLKATSEFIKANPISSEVMKKRQKLWEKLNSKGDRKTIAE